MTSLLPQNMRDSGVWGPKLNDFLRLTFDEDTGRMIDPIHDVRAYGAVGDGSTDDTIAIQAAVDAAAVSHFPVFLPEGNYKITSPISITAARIKMFGVGYDSHITASGFSSNEAILDFVTDRITPSTHTYISDMYLRGESGAAATDSWGLSFDKCVYVRVSNVIVSHCGRGISVGDSLGGGTTLYLDNCYVAGCCTNGHFDNIRSLISMNCIFEAAKEIGLWMRDVVRSVFYNPWLEQNEIYGIYISDTCKYCKFIGGFFHHAGSNYSIYADGNTEKITFDTLTFSTAKAVLNESSNPLYFINCEGLPAVTGEYRTSLDPLPLFYKNEALAYENEVLTIV